MSLKVSVVFIQRSYCFHNQSTPAVLIARYALPSNGEDKEIDLLLVSLILKNALAKDQWRALRLEPWFDNSPVYSAGEITFDLLSRTPSSLNPSFPDSVDPAQCVLFKRFFETQLNSLILTETACNARKAIKTKKVIPYKAISDAINKEIQQITQITTQNIANEELECSARKALEAQEVNSCEEINSAIQISTQNLIQITAGKIDHALDTLREKISTVDKHLHQNAHQCALTLLNSLSALCDHYKLKPDFIHSNIRKHFTEQCRQLIIKAMPTLEKDLSWGDYLKNLLKLLMNAVIGLFSSNPNRLFPLTRPESVISIENSMKELELATATPV